MANRINWFEIPVKDFDRAKRFYDAILGMTIQDVTMGDYRMGMFDAEYTGGVSGAIVQGDDCRPSMDGVTIYLNGGEDLSGILDKVIGAGGSIMMPKTQITPEIGYMAFFTDTEGNKIGLHSEK